MRGDEEEKKTWTSTSDRVDAIGKGSTTKTLIRPPQGDEEGATDESLMAAIPNTQFSPQNEIVRDESAFENARKITLTRYPLSTRGTIILVCPVSSPTTGTTRYLLALSWGTLEPGYMVTGFWYSTGFSTLGLAMEKAPVFPPTPPPPPLFCILSNYNVLPPEITQDDWSH